MPYYFGFTLCCMEDGKRLAKSIQDTLAYLALFIDFSFLQIVFRRKGTMYLVLWNIKNNRGGVLISVQLTARLLTVIYCAKALAVMDYTEFSKAFSAIRLPEELSFMLSYAIHLVPKFLGQLKGFVTGLKLRGIDTADLSFSKRLQVYKQLSITALAELIRSSETAAIALELRGFRSEGKHSILHQQKFSYRDLLCLLIFGALVVLVIRI